MPTISELMKTANAQAEEAKRLSEQAQALQQQQQNITAGANALNTRLDALQKPVVGSQIGTSKIDMLSDAMSARANKGIAELQGNTTPTSNEDYLKNLAETMTPALSQEEIDRRARAIQQRESFGALGDTLNAFANLIAVGQGAENQTLPTTPKSEAGTWKDKQEAKLAEYNKAKYLDYRQALEDGWRQREWDNKVTQQQQQQANIEAEWAREDKRYQDNLAQQQAELAENIRRNKAVEAATNRELSVAEQNAKTRAYEAETTRNWRETGSGKSTTSVVADANGNNYIINKDAFNEPEVMGNVAPLLGIPEYQWQKLTKDQKADAIAQAIAESNTAVIRKLQELGYAMPQGQGMMQPAGYSMPSYKSYGGTTGKINRNDAGL